MEYSETGRSPVSKGLAVAVSSLALVAVTKNTAAHQPGQDQDPVQSHHLEIQPAPANPPKGDLLQAVSTSSTGNPTRLKTGFELYPHHSLSKYCANISRRDSPKEKIQYGTFKFFIRRGLTPAQSAGIGGNFGQESDWDPSDSGGFLGQWGGGRLSALEQYAQRLGKPVTAPIVQLKYTWLELTGGPGAGEDDRPILRHLRASTTVREAATVFSTEYERPRDPQLENRITYGEQILHKFGHVACTSHTGVVAKIAVPEHSSTS